MKNVFKSYNLHALSQFCINNISNPGEAHLYILGEFDNNKYRATPVNDI